MTQTATLVHRTRAEFVAFCKAENHAFLNANRQNVYVEYVRDRKGGPTAVLVAFKNSDGTIQVGWSASLPATAQSPVHRFDKAIGLWKAIRRATGQSGQPGSTPHRVMSHYDGFVGRAAYQFHKPPKTA